MSRIGSARLVAFVKFMGLWLAIAYLTFVIARSYIQPTGTSLPIGQCEYNSSSSLPWRNWTEKTRACLLSRMREMNSVWFSLHEAVAACVGEPCWRMMDVWYLPNLYDLKFAVLPRLNNTNDAQNDGPHCIAVTLGIGKDIGAELALQSLLPTCKFYGADPVRVVSYEYESVLKGKYYETAVVGTGSGPNEAMLQNEEYAYRRETLPNSTSLSDFLLFNVTQKRIDYFFLDNEGAELGVLEQMAYGESLERNGIVICQMSIEFHARPWVHPPLGVDGFQFAQIVQTLITRSPMMPFWASPPALHAPHQIAFYINTQHPYCIDKYFSIGR